MDKKESPNTNNKTNDFQLKPSGVGQKISGFMDKVFSVIKFLLGLCLLPFVYSVTVMFFKEFSHIGQSLQNYFWLGMVSLAAFYLFIWEPAIIYAGGQKIIEAIFNFFKPMVKVAPYLVPIYAIIIFVIYEFLSLFSKDPGLLHSFFFLFGFSISLHLICSAKALRGKQTDFLKANYIFGFSFVYIVNVIIVAFFIGFIAKNFSFANFSGSSFQIASDLITAVLKQLF